MQDALPSEDRPGEPFGVSEFLDRVAAALDGTAESARQDTSAVTGGELNNLLTQLQLGYAALLGKPELSS